MRYAAGDFPFGVATPVFFDDFVDYVKSDDCVDLWGDEDDAEAVGRPLPTFHTVGHVYLARCGPTSMFFRRDSDRNEYCSSVHGNR